MTYLRQTERVEAEVSRDEALQLIAAGRVCWFPIHFDDSEFTARETGETQTMKLDEGDYLLIIP